MHIPDRRSAVEEASSKWQFTLTRQEKSCVALLDVERELEWSFGRDGKPMTKSVLSSVQQTAVILYQRGIEVTTPCKQDNSSRWTLSAFPTTHSSPSPQQTSYPTPWPSAGPAHRPAQPTSAATMGCASGPSATSAAEATSATLASTAAERGACLTVRSAAAYRGTVHWASDA
ncbi:uncharacterized protein Aud_005578 [Aspergillus udagawae]|uniref:Uncharacterized protein n=1 Tax=Aspergillus udagawae TaxID=91492 RepID=A0A8E0QRL6_9EURO|nr:uncharacterized protein Aud_005578 [Aspergillus udagawae]GIC89175.1 hypothetical protein Aud_005578 [Aspergillus udagawae]